MKVAHKTLLEAVADETFIHAEGLRASEEIGKMKARWSKVFGAFFIVAGLGTSNLQAQESAIAASVLHIQQTQTISQSSQNGFPTYLAMYHVLDGAKSPAEALSLMGTISLKNYDPTLAKSYGYWPTGRANVPLTIST